MGAVDFGLGDPFEADDLAGFWHAVRQVVPEDVLRRRALLTSDRRGFTPAFRLTVGEGAACWQFSGNTPAEVLADLRTCCPRAWLAPFLVRVPSWSLHVDGQARHPHGDPLCPVGV